MLSSRVSHYCLAPTKAGTAVANSQLYPVAQHNRNNNNNNNNHG